MRHDTESHDPHRKLQGFPNLMNDRLPERETGSCRFHLTVEQFLNLGGGGRNPKTRRTLLTCWSVDGGWQVGAGEVVGAGMEGSDHLTSPTSARWSYPAALLTCALF